MSASGHHDRLSSKGRETRTMLMEKLKDQWICSCGNWVDGDFLWCPGCSEDRDGEETGSHLVEKGPEPFSVFPR